MAALTRRQQEEQEKQEIYEGYMNLASIRFSKEPEFNIDAFSKNMQHVYMLCEIDRRENLYTGLFYVLRENKQMITPIDELSYKGLHTIFEEHFPSIVESDKNPNKKLTTSNNITYNNNIKGVRLSNKYLTVHTEGAYPKVKPFEQIGELVSIRKKANESERQEAYNPINTNNTIKKRKRINMLTSNTITSNNIPFLFIEQNSSYNYDVAFNTTIYKSDILSYVNGISNSTINLRVSNIRYNNIIINNTRYEAIYNQTTADEDNYTISNYTLPFEIGIEQLSL